MGEKSRRKREDRARREALKRLAERNRAGSKTLHGARVRITVGGKEIGLINNIEYGVPYAPGPGDDHEVVVIDSLAAMGMPRDDRRYSMGAEIKGTFKIVESREELERRLALAEARARDLEAVLGDRLEEQGMPRSPMLARLAKVPDVEKALQVLYQMGIGPQTTRSLMFGIEGPHCCPPQENRHITYGPTVHDDGCPLMAALLVLGGAEEEKRREIEFHQRTMRELQRRQGLGEPLIVSPTELEAYRRAISGSSETMARRLGLDGVPVFRLTETDEAVQRLVDDIDFQLTPAVPPGEPPHG